MNIPSAEAQLLFLTKIQRLFAEGDFTATYKFALLITLAELAVERSGTPSQSELTTRDIAVKFIELYWKQSFDYVAGLPGTRAGVLVQNLGEQAAIVNALRHFRERVGPASSTLVAAQAHSQFAQLVTEVARTVSAQPLSYLQNFGGSTDPFLYARLPAGRVRLNPGVAYCLQRFQPLIQQLARTHWIDHVKKNRRNASLVGEASDLEAFLFSTSRATLMQIGRGLRKLDGSACFYCREAMTDHAVDHFVPFATYPRDLGHNFVLAHASCNSSKADTLAGKDYLAGWIERIDRQAAQLTEIAAEAGLPHDLEATLAVARWSYRSTMEAGGVAWIRKREYQHVDASFLALLPNPAA